MVIEIAGIPTEIRCQYKENEFFFRNYVTDRSPVMIISPVEADKERIRKKLSLGGTPTPPSDIYLENTAIHALLTDALLEHHVLLMHGSALCMDGNGYIFTASSGTGKSTHARLWREVFGDRVWMINDDKPLLKIGDTITIYGSPWNGKHRLGCNSSAPLKAIIELTRDTVNHIEPLAKTDLFQLLLTHAYKPESPTLLARTLDLEDRLICTTDFYKMGCNMDHEAAIVAWKGITGDFNESGGQVP